ncbi:MAG: tetratricopeptide repeat protein [Porticoccaceae bacterium]|jgi:tetratricopeptide (TPR) repeat protein|nr:tetratricopeptide repeat protein [Porticoccaceae bacterium]HLS97966.1 tetratricopeptide repeat protein [Porticoccaceae bacterium]
MQVGALDRKWLLRSVAALVLPLAVAMGAQGQEQERKYDDVKTKQRQAVGQQCGKALEGVQALTEAESWAQAQSALQGASGACKTSYEKSQVYNFLGYVLYSQDKYKEAVQAYTNMIREPEADQQQVINTRYTVAQLYLILEDYPSAIRELEAWMKVSPTVNADAKVLLAQAYYQTERKNDALRLVEEAIREQESKGVLPKEGWWSLQRVLYYEKDDYKRVVDILKKLIKHYPSFSYWRQLGGMYGELNQEINQLVATEVTYLAGDLDEERQLVSLAYMYMGAGAPYMGARIIEKGMKEGKIKRTGENLEVLGLAYQQGNDSKKALPVLEEAAKAAGKGSLYARLSGVYLDLDENEKSVAAARNAISRGGVDRIDITYMNLGNALINLHCYDDAIKAFRQAANSERSAKYAQQWIEFAEKEGERRGKLIESGAKIQGCKKV